MVIGEVKFGAKSNFNSKESRKCASNNVVMFLKLNWRTIVTNKFLNKQSNLFYRHYIIHTHILVENLLWPMLRRLIMSLFYIFIVAWIWTLDSPNFNTSWTNL